MLFAIALTLIATASGALLTYTYDEGAPFASRLCAGACIGFAALGLIGFVLASVLGLTPLSLGLAAIFIGAPLLLLLNSERRAAVQDDLSSAARGISRAINHPDRHTAGYFFFYAIVSILLWLAFDRSMFERPDGIYTGVVNNFGDLPFHLSVITSFAHGENFPPEDPTFAGVRFTYPFIADFVSAMLSGAGASLSSALFIENFLLGVALVGVLHHWGLVLTRDRIAGLVTPLLVLFSGGFGWYLLFSDANSSDRGLFGILMHLQQHYTIGEPGWSWGNSLRALFITQRGILLGLPLAVIVFTQWWAVLWGREEGKRQKEKGKKGNDRSQQSNSKREARSAAPPSAAPGSLVFPFSFFLLPSSRRMIAAGAVAGFLPLVHAHSYVVVMAMGGLIALLLGRSQWREWALFFVAAGAIGGAQILWVTHGSSVKTGTFFGWHVGWDHGDENIVWFWFKNTGLFIPALVLALVWRGREYLVPHRWLLFYLPFTLCFILPNLMLFAPWVWDNIKVIFYWYVASAPIVALVIARLYRGRAWIRASAIALFLSLILAGALDVWAVASRAGEWRIFDEEGIAFARLVERATRPRAVILHAPTHLTPIFLTGRQSFMGYPGHIWSHGLDPGQRETEIKRIYAGGPDAASLLAQRRIEYAVVGPQERSMMPVNEAFFSHYQNVGEVGGYRLYKVAP